MIIYIIFIMTLFLLMSLSGNNKARNSKELQSPVVIHERSFSMGLNLSIFLLILLSALRFDVGWDYMAYYETIEYGRITNLVLNKEHLNILLMEFSKDLGMTQIYFIITSIISISFIMSVIKNYSNDYWISLFFFITFPLLFLNSLSVIRNFVAISITFYGFKYIKSRNLIKYIVLVIIASLFHKSALIALLFYLIANIKLKKTIYLLILMITPLLGNLVNSLVLKYSSRYSLYVGITSTQEGTKAIIIFILLGIVAIMLKDRLQNENENFNMYFNIYFIGLCVYLAFYRQGTMGHRLSLYGTIYSLIIIPDIINLFTYKKDKMIIKFLFYSFCILIFFYIIYVGRETYLPYKFFFM